MGRPKKAAGTRQRGLLTIRGTDAWKAWLDGLAASKRLPVTLLIDQALADLAKRSGYPDPPPRY